MDKKTIEAKLKVLQAQYEKKVTKQLRDQIAVLKNQLEENN